MRVRTRTVLSIDAAGSRIGYLLGELAEDLL
jgi:hypothetical protein